MNAKHFFVTFFFVAFLSNFSFSQVDYTASVSVGSSYSSLRSDLFNTHRGRLGMTAGLSFVVPVNDRLYFNPEISFVQKGSPSEAGLIRPETAPSIRNYNYFYNSFEVNVMAGYKPFELLPIRVQLGAFLDANSHRLDDRTSELFVGNIQDFDTAIPASDLNDAFGGIDYGPVVGLGFGEGRVRFNVRYYKGVRNLYDFIEFAPVGHSIRSSAVRFTASYFLF